MTVDNNLTSEETLKIVEKNEKVKNILANKKIIKKICVVNKIVNFVIK